MPRGDRSGPDGMGPMTGRRAGFCAGFPTPGYANRGPGVGYGLGRGRGYGMGRGMGYGRGYGYGYANQYAAPYAAPYPYPAAPAPAPTAEQEAGMLKDQADYLERELKGIQDRLSELDSEK